MADDQLDQASHAYEPPTIEPLGSVEQLTAQDEPSVLDFTTAG
jgi:hypothetical protein